MKDCGFTTLLLHGKNSRSYPQGAILPPISQVTAFQYESMEDLERVFAHKSPGFAYTRIGNPTVSAFENRINELEGGFGAVATGSGMAAIVTAVLAVCESGDEIIAGAGLYGGTIDLFHDLEKLGIHTVYADRLDADAVRSLATDKTRLVFGELISNPSLAVLDVPALAKAAHEQGLPLFVDSTTATPYLARPLSLGADAVIHSTSKYINGGGNSVGGIIVSGGSFSWDFGRHRALSGFSQYGKLAFLARLRADIFANLGTCQSPMNAYLTYIGADTMGLRMDRICRTADALARRLAEEPDITVNYLTLADHPYHEYAERELGGLGGGILTLRAGSRERAFRIINSLKYARIASNLGDLRTLVIHPASTLYVRTSKEEAEKAGVYDDTIRISVGIEDPEDLIQDFLEAVAVSREVRD